MRSSFLIAGLAIAAAVILGLTYYYRVSTEPAGEATEAVALPPAGAPADQERTSTTPVPVMEETPPSPVVRAPQLVLPPLNGSDGFVRGRLPATLPPGWIGKEDLLRRFAVVVENARRGELPRRQLGFLAPEGKFLVREKAVDGTGEVRLFIDPAGYRRFDRHLDVLESVPPATLAALLSDAAPLIQQAMQELGVADAPSEQMAVAIDQLLAVPVLEGDVELIQPKVFYEYADPALEGLSSLQKQALRMGPDNVKRLKTYLTTLRAELDKR
ncbi:MAG TPA: DUF3014 domain-containing protein [Pseudomonadales bacterium]